MTRTSVAMVFAPLVLALLCGGCFSAGRDFAAAPVKTIEKGVTTKADIQQHFGEPFRRGIDDGYESWTYLYNSWSAFSTLRSKDLYVVFNKDGTVRSYTFNSNLND